jgi:hypothetical protein
MADSFVTFTGDGTTTLFSIPFDYLDNAHVTALVDSVETAITFPTVGQAQFSVAPANGASGKISRTTPRSTREVVWQNAANLSAGDLNTSDLQLLYIAQESFDAVVNTAQDAIDAGLSATSAQESAVAAALSESTAASTLILVQAIYDDFDDAWLGAKASDPTTDNDGDPLNSGDLYFNTTDSNLRIYDEGSVTWLVLDLQVSDGSISLIKLADIPESTIIGRSDGTGTGVPQALTSDQAAAVVGFATESRSGVVELANTSEMDSGASSKVPDAATVKGFIDNYNNALQTVAVANVDTSSGTLVNNKSVGVTMVRDSTGRLTGTLTEAMLDTNYIVNATGANANLVTSGGTIAITITSTTVFQVALVNSGNALRDGLFMITVIGEKA